MQADDGSGRWYTIAEAAPLLGVSVDTVRRRLKRGELEARQVHTQHGPTWELRLGTLQEGPATVPTQAAQGAAEGPVMIEALRLVDRLQRENVELAGRVGYLQAQLAAADERIRMLEAPSVSTVVDVDDPPIEPPPTPEPLTPHPNGQASAPWWRRWWAWVLL